MSCLLHGYCKQHRAKSFIPIEIIETCLSFYDPSIYLTIPKQPKSTQIHTINGFSFILTDELNNNYHELQINMIFTKLRGINSKKVSVISKFRTIMNDEKIIGNKEYGMHDVKTDPIRGDKGIGYVIQRMSASKLLETQSIEFSFHFDIVYIDHIGINKYEDVSYEWIFNENTLNAIHKNTRNVHSPQTFGMDKMFYLTIDCVGDIFDLYLCTRLINMDGMLKIDKIKVMLSPINENEKCKVWRATDIELNAKSEYALARRKKWKFSKKKMMKYLSNHSLIIELKGLHVVSEKNCLDL